jgi:hypothetical protein
LCAAGSGDDTIELSPFTVADPFGCSIFLDSPLPAIESGTLTIKENPNLKCTVLLKHDPVTLHGAYFEVNAGATLVLSDKINITTGLGLDFATNRSLFYVNGGTLRLEGLGVQSFSNNGKKPPEFGGVIFNEKGTVKISGTYNFMGNTATNAGGAVYNHLGSVSGILFASENSARFGGVIYNDGGTIELNTVPSLFLSPKLDNNSALDGACIFTHNGSVTLNGTTCQDNQSLGAGRGGGLFAETNSHIKIINSTFQNNHEGNQDSGGYGGAIFADASSTLQFDGATNCSNNSALAGGCLWTANPSLTLDNLTCSGNSARVGGCAEMNADHGTLKITNSNLSENHVSNGGLGGALTARKSTLSLSNTSLTKNSADTGGAIYLDREATLTADNLDCQQNSSTKEGGCIFGEGEVGKGAAGITLSNSKCIANTSFDGGCLDTPRGGTVTISGSQITNNKASFGGGLLVQRKSKVVIANSTITGNDAGGRADAVGGGIFAFDHTDVTMTGSTVAANTASNQGAGMQVQEFSSLTAVNSTFANEGPVDQPAHGIHFVGSFANLISNTFYNAPLAVDGIVKGELRNSILFNSSICLGNLHDAGFNIQFPAPFTTCETSIPVVDPMLDPGGLKNNGGPTQTIAELKGSPAIDSIPLMMCTDQDGKPLKVDQRGLPRPDPKGDQTVCDKGAFEFQAP